MQASKECSTTGGHATTDMLMHASKTTLAKGESTDHYLERITHVTLNNKKLSTLTNLDRCTNVKVLYLYDNKIAHLDSTLSSLRHLTHLHLQRNRISKMEHFEALVHLEKLYLEGNRISRLAGLAHCTLLHELHLSNQTLGNDEEDGGGGGDGCGFTFEAHSMATLGQSLRILNVSNCNIRDPQPIQSLRRLESLDLSRNCIHSIDDVYGLVGNLRSLKELNLTNNSVNATPKYRDNTIIFSHASLATLDNKPIDAKQRATMQTHMAFKHKKRHYDPNARAISSTNDDNPPMSLSLNVLGNNPWVSVSSPNQDHH
ncbi:hypothetical protein H257_07502 [Aphanomyces astaci]|uniref:U2A'/phosphoprotein 32 family A C-terminal domain-containing protein n=1 Tax=Aphanomyces astaci TaxID=112090 RepID=W4GIG9_APHAT|nr:hypothetical protein H257_07502 [Aphanomyces astaci]ETV79510.1 hypothetical protein H257_07502 [Aphanomyces astaci]|eukprot:XP_009831351.1 hypothetical protein H257_07502 [Aphanomyces astaci]